MHTIHNVIIIGGGPAGLSAGVYASRGGLKPLLFAGSPPGGQLMLTTEVENFPGYIEIMGPSLVEQLRKQTEHFGTEIRNENIASVDFSKKPFVLQTSKKEYHARSVIIATGAQALWLGLESETRLRGKGVSACATCDGFFFREKIVAVVGGGDTAMEEAQTLTRFAKKVYVIHRRGEFRASKIMQERVLNNDKVEVIWHATVEEIIGENKVEGVKLKKEKEGGSSKGEIQNVELEGVFIAIGHKPDTAVFQDHIEVDKKGYIMTSAMKGPGMGSMTTVPGVFAAGDCVDHAYRQAGTAAGMGIAAALDVERWLAEVTL